MKFESINPFDGKIVGQHQAHSQEEVDKMLQNSQQAFIAWSDLPLSRRADHMKRAGAVLRDNLEEYARMITTEMGKPISESRSEIKKCAWVCDYYSEHASEFLNSQMIETDGQTSFVRHDPLGSILAIMPWNFPFWQVFRFAAPTLTAGNTALLKHAANVFGCAKQIEDVFNKAGFPQGVFQSLMIHHDKTEPIMANDIVKAVTLTGSERAGKAVAEVSGKYLKKTVLELGGNNAFIVWKDADIDQTVETAITARMLNGGQSCIAAKRFILVKDIYQEFVDKFTEAASQLRTGDPMQKSTKLGPLARKDLADSLHEQVERSVKAGATLLLGGEQSGCFYHPTVLGNVKPGMPAFDEETFGPVAAMIEARDEEHAFELSENSKYGLGVSVCTRDVDRAMRAASSVSDGAYFVNELVKSDPRLPFGGTKNSGYGRELAKDGMMEFINRKTVYVA